MTKRNAEILLASVIIARSTSFLFSKISLEHMGKFNLLSIRFIVAFIFLFIIFNKKLRKINKYTILKGALLGFSFFSVMTFELAGLKTTPTSTTSFLENTAIILVPIFEAIIRKKFPSFSCILSSIIAMFGVAMLTLKSSISISIGEIYCILAAVFYAVSIILTDRVSKNDDSFAIGIFQVGFLGLFSTIASFIFETPKLPNSPNELANILVLAIICTGFGFTLQPVAQKYTSSEKAGLFCALSPAITLIIGFIFLGENIGITGFLGSTLILISIFIPKIVSNIRINNKYVANCIDK